MTIQDILDKLTSSGFGIYIGDHYSITDLITDLKELLPRTASGPYDTPRYTALGDDGEVCGNYLSADAAFNAVGTIGTVCRTYGPSTLTEKELQHEESNPIHTRTPDIDLNRVRSFRSDGGFCAHCGAGVGNARRIGEGTCRLCDPEGCARHAGTYQDTGRGRL